MKQKLEAQHFLSHNPSSGQEERRTHRSHTGTLLRAWQPHNPAISSLAGFHGATSLSGSVWGPLVIAEESSVDGCTWAATASPGATCSCLTPSELLAPSESRLLSWGRQVLIKPVFRLHWDLVVGSVRIRGVRLFLGSLSSIPDHRGDAVQAKGHMAA